MKMGVLQIVIAFPRSINAVVYILWHVCRAGVCLWALSFGGEGKKKEKVKVLDLFQGPARHRAVKGNFVRIKAGFCAAGETFNRKPKRSQVMLVWLSVALGAMAVKRNINRFHGKTTIAQALTLRSRLSPC